MTNKDLQDALLNKIPVTYTDYFHPISTATVTAIVIRNVDGALSITSVELGDKNGKAFYHVLPKHVEYYKTDKEKATTHCE